MVEGGKRGWSLWATSEGHRARGWCLNTERIQVLCGRLCGRPCGPSPASSDPQQPGRWSCMEMLLVWPKSHSVCWTLLLVSSVLWPEDVDGDREGKGPQWTKEAGKEFHFPNLGCMTASRQRARPLPAQTLRAPQPIMPQSGRLTSRSRPDWKNPPIKQPLVFPCPICTIAV